MTKKKFIQLLGAFLMVFLNSNTVEGQLPPGLPSLFYGTVTENGSYKAAGTIISAWVNDGEVATATIEYFEDISVYSIFIPGDFSENGDEIIFKIGDKQAHETGTWTSKEITLLDLTFSSGNEPPTVFDIPDQIIYSGETFATFDLDEYVDDPNHDLYEIRWEYSSPINLKLSIAQDTHVVSITYTDGWLGSETITFRAIDPGGLIDSDSVSFTVRDETSSPHQIFLPLILQ